MVNLKKLTELLQRLEQGINSLKKQKIKFKDLSLDMYLTINKINFHDTKSAMLEGDAKKKKINFTMPKPVHAILIPNTSNEIYKLS